MGKMLFVVAVILTANTAVASFGFNSQVMNFVTTATLLADHSYASYALACSCNDHTHIHAYIDTCMDYHTVLQVLFA